MLGDPFERQVSQLIQVSVTIQDEATREREVRALHEAMEEFSIDSSTIVTMDEASTIEVDSGIIQVLPAWEWLRG